MLLEVSNDLLDLAKIEAGQAVIIIVEDDVNSYMASLDLLKIEGVKSVQGGRL